MTDDPVLAAAARRRDDADQALNELVAAARRQLANVGDETWAWALLSVTETAAPATQMLAAAAIRLARQAAK